jgi:hypothetical protein
VVRHQGGGDVQQWLFAALARVEATSLGLCSWMIVTASARVTKIENQTESLQDEFK